MHNSQLEEMFSHAFIGSFIMYLISPCKILVSIFVRHSLTVYKQKQRENLVGFKVGIKDMLNPMIMWSRN